MSDASRRHNLLVPQRLRPLVPATCGAITGLLAVFLAQIGSSQAEDVQSPRPIPPVPVVSDEVGRDEPSWSEVSSPDVPSIPRNEAVPVERANSRPDLSRAAVVAPERPDRVTGLIGLR